MSQKVQKEVKEGKRFISVKEREWLVDFIPLKKEIPYSTALSIQNNQKRIFLEQFDGIRIYPSILPMLKNELERNYWKSLVSAGESVGISCAQSIGEKQTQQVLNSFHTCGQSEKLMTDGVPRFQEIINCSKKPKNITFEIHLKDEFKKISITELKDNVVKNRIKGVLMEELVKDVFFFTGDFPEEKWYTTWNLLKWGVKKKKMDKKFSGMIRYHLNLERCYKYKIDMTTISKSIREKYDDCIIIPSPLTIGVLDIFWSMENIKLDDEKYGYINEENRYEIYLEEVVNPIIQSITVCGIPTIDDIYYQRNQNGDWIIQVGGTKCSVDTYREVLELDFIEINKTVSSCLWHIYDILGIEACRQYILNELMNIMSGINGCHAKLLVDRMTHKGTLSSISRYTLKKDTCGPISKASFEETMDNFLQAGVLGSQEPTDGLSASVVCGKKANLGTGFFDLKMMLNI